MDFLELGPAQRESIMRAPPAGLLPVHHPIWCDILSALGEDMHLLAAVDGSIVRGWLMYTVTRARGVTVVNSLPYVAYGGPFAGDANVERGLLRRLGEVARSLDAHVLSVGGSPLLSEEEEQRYAAALEPTHVFQSPLHLQSMETHPLDQVTAKRRDAMESEIRRSARAGFVAVDHLDERQLEDWLTLYRTRYAEIGAQPYPDAFHRELHRRAVPAGIAEIRGVVDPSSERLVGGIVFLVSPREATYFSSAFATDVRHLYPTTFLLDAAFRAFQSRGIQTFNWHSSPTPGVRAYKRRWGPREHRHLYFSVLLKRETPLFSLPVDEVRRLFPQRFVLPFSAWPR